MNPLKLVVAASLAWSALTVTGAANAQSSAMTFFITSAGSGKGADYAGLAGADKHCRTLAAAAGAGNHTWHAYLSTNAAQGAPAINARDRIGSGPWQNAKGVVVAHNVDELHGNNNLNKQTALSEKGEVINGRGDTPNKHDILTGSKPDGTSFNGYNDTTCGNWTKSAEGGAQLGHHDRLGLTDDDAAHSWNSSHISRGCSDELLRTTGSAGLLYCFAVKEPFTREAPAAIACVRITAGRSEARVSQTITRRLPQNRIGANRCAITAENARQAAPAFEPDLPTRRKS